MNNLTNKSFGEWSVISFVGRNKYRQPIWKCRCSCGTVREIPESNLTRKASTNCGCLKSKNQRKRAYKHGKLMTTGASRTGCMFCMLGVHLEKEPNRFQRMAVTHPQLYDYCINKLGCGKVLDYIGVNYQPLQGKEVNDC